MKSWVQIAFLGILFGLIQNSMQNNCMSGASVTSFQWDDMGSGCHEMIQGQIQMELRASITYIAMSIHFSHDKTYRPGMSKLFLESANEERDHAKKLMEYLHMRGRDCSSSTITSIIPYGIRWATMEKALEMAVEMEKNVTDAIKGIIRVCGGEIKSTENINDYHTVDYLTGSFLTEQYEGIRKFVGHLSALSRMRDQYGSFAEVIYDKTFLQ